MIESLGSTQSAGSRPVIGATKSFAALNKSLHIFRPWVSSSENEAVKLQNIWSPFRFWKFSILGCQALQRAFKKPGTSHKFLFQNVLYEPEVGGKSLSHSYPGRSHRALTLEETGWECTAVNMEMKKLRPSFQMAPRRVRWPGME